MQSLVPQANQIAKFPLRFFSHPHGKLNAAMGFFSTVTPTKRWNLYLYHIESKHKLTDEVLFMVHNLNL